MYENPEAEAVLLSAMLHGYPIDSITEEDITAGTYKSIYRAMVNLHDKQCPIDLVSVGTELQTMNRKGLSTVLMQVSEQYFKGVNYDYYAEALKINTSKRKIRDGLQFVQDQLAMTDNPSEIKANILEYFSGIPLPGQKKDDSLKTVLLKTQEHIEYKYNNKNDTSLHTGIPDLDKSTGGLHKGEYTILAARPSVGKTALGIQIAVNLARKGVTVQCFSREMSQVQLALRMIASQGSLDGFRLRTGNITDGEWQKIMHTINTLFNYPLYIDDSTANMPDIRSVCRDKLLNANLGVVVIDYLQLLQSVKKADTREREVADISRAIKEMTLEFNVPIIVLSQLNRSASNRRPTLENLRESGSIEQDADNVIFLHKPDEKDVEPEDKTTYREIRASNRDFLEVILAKQRNGPTGIFSIAYNPRYIRFETIYKGV